MRSTYTKDDFLIFIYSQLISLRRPFLIQSDSASRKRPFSTGPFFDGNLLILLLIVSRVDFIVFVLFLS